MLLPDFIKNKILLYNIHPIAVIVKDHYLNCIVRDIMCDYKINIYPFEFPVKPVEILSIYMKFRKYPFYPYYINFLPEIGSYGALEILDDD